MVVLMETDMYCTALMEMPVPHSALNQIPSQSTTASQVGKFVCSQFGGVQYPVDYDPGA